MCGIFKKLSLYIFLFACAEPGVLLFWFAGFQLIVLKYGR